LQLRLEIQTAGNVHISNCRVQPLCIHSMTTVVNIPQRDS